MITIESSDPRNPICQTTSMVGVMSDKVMEEYEGSPIAR